MTDVSNIDITQDLGGGPSDASLGDAVPHGANDLNGGVMNTPLGAQPLNQPVQQPAQQQDPLAPAQQEPSLRDTLSSAFKGNDGKPADQQNALTAQKPDPLAPAAPANQQQQATPPVQLTQDGEGKWRAPDGTFASAEQITAFQTAQQATTQQQAAQSSLYAGMTPVEQQQFQSLPAELRTLYERKMEGLNVQQARYGEYDQLEQYVIGPRRQEFANAGIHPAMAINNLFALSDFAGRDPGGFIMHFAQQRGIDLDALMDQYDAQNANTDPALRQLQGQVNQLTGQLQMQTTAAQQAAQQQRLETVQRFSQATDQSGQLLRPYITEVMDGWHAQITALKAANPLLGDEQLLEQAYQAACWANPAVRQRMQEQATQAQQAADAARVEAAKAAGGSVSGAPVASANQAPNNGNRTLREELEAAFAEHSV